MTTITYYGLSVTVESSNYNLLAHLNRFLDQFYTSKQMAYGKVDQMDCKLFASKVKDQGVYYLHTNQFIHFYQHLGNVGFKLEDVVKVDKREYAVQAADFKIRDHWVLRDYQKPIVEFLMDNPTKSKLVPIATGQGKTTIALHAIGYLKQKLGIVILPAFIDKWVQDISDVHEASTKDVMVIQGSKALRGVIEMAKHGEAAKSYYIFSSRTMQDYVSAYEDNPDYCLDLYGAHPIELFPLLGIGVMLIDESHMHWHAMFKTLIHTNVKYQIGLTATLLSDDPVIERVYGVVYPEKTIYGDKLIEKHIDVYPIAYNIPPHLIGSVKTTNYGSNSYAHMAFEQSILKRRDLTACYMRLVESTLTDFYFSDYEKGDKALIFVATVKLAGLLSAKIKDSNPKLKVKRYCQDDPYENLMESDIVVSTVLSSGTAVDIKGLRVVVQTVSIASPTANIQNLGRLRKMPGKDTKFCYLYCPNIPKQKEYHMKRVDLFADRALSIRDRQSRVGF